MQKPSIKPNIELAKHIEKLRAKNISNIVARDTIIFWGTAADKSYLYTLKGCIGNNTVLLRLEPITTTYMVKMFCAEKKVTKVISTSVALLEKLLDWNKRAAPSLDAYAGSYFKLAPLKADGKEIEIVFINPLKQLMTVPYGTFMATRLISKLIAPENWKSAASFSWEVLTPEIESARFAKFSTAFLIAIDIETFKENATIRCVSYTAFFYGNEQHTDIQSHSVVLPLIDEYSLGILRKWNTNLRAPKVMQGGMYDIAYLSRYSAPVYNYLFDTASLFHSWYSELPKDLGFLNAFFVRDATYWKDLAETNDLFEYYRYCALDSWGTGNALLMMLLEAPQWVLQNYVLEFPTIFPCHLAEMTGIERDTARLYTAYIEAEKEIIKLSGELDRILGTREFNVSSPKQMRSLLIILGCADLDSTGANDLAKARFRHPLNARIIGKVLAIRKQKKLVSTYLTPGKEFSRLDKSGSRVLFSLKPYATDTSRLASREHHFWCGVNIQNTPRGTLVKSTMKADPGFYLAEVDLEQAESRDTAYISGDSALIDAVENSADFHAMNASNFFGVPFHKIYDADNHKVLDKKLRDLAKRVNHGANYNMGAYVMVDTMGEEKIVEAQKLLNLPPVWDYVHVAEHLLEVFHTTYPGIKRTYYAGMVEEVMRVHRLQSTAVHYCADPMEYTARVVTAARWTRFCFGNPTKSKSHLNAYVAHCPQSLNAQTLNKAWIRIFIDIAIHPKHSQNFKLVAQIHDSILFQYRIGHEYLCDMVKERMEIPITIRAYDGRVRSFMVPAAVKKGKDPGATYWSELE